MLARLNLKNQFVQQYLVKHEFYLNSKNIII